MERGYFGREKMFVTIYPIKSIQLLDGFLPVRYKGREHVMTGYLPSKIQGPLACHD